MKPHARILWIGSQLKKKTSLYENVKIIELITFVFNKTYLTLSLRVVGTYIKINYFFFTTNP
jgi:hypothetical protein